MTALADLIAESRVLCVVGPGGVGKTTTAAAIGVCAAQAGRRVLIITIDPAKRLASAMGIADLAQVAREVRLPGMDGAGTISLHAMMLDLKSAWDDMVRRLAQDQAQRDRILGNRFYHSLSTALAGAQEYVAAEQLYTLCTERDYDLIVLDTPPSVHAIDFLEAPGRLLDVLENEAFKLFLTPAASAGRAAGKLFDLSGRYIMQTLTKLTGAEMLHALYEFLAALQSMYPVFRERSLGFRDIFSSRTTSFVVVATPARQALSEVIALADRLVEDRLHLGAVVINQVRAQLTETPQIAELESAIAALDQPEHSSRLAAACLQAVEQSNRRARAEIEVIDETLADLPPYPRVFVPRLAQDVHDMSTLTQVARELCPHPPSSR